MPPTLEFVFKPTGRKAAGVPPRWSLCSIRPAVRLIANAVTARLSLWGIEMRVWIPANAAAAVHVPARDAAAVTEGEGGAHRWRRDGFRA